ncbi:F-box domain-containing protein, partial [Dioscorea alata]
MQGHAPTSRFDGLNNDLVLEILSWLPLPSIARFKRVCKSWYSIIYDPYFITCKRHHDADVIATLELGIKGSKYYYLPNYGVFIPLVCPCLSIIKSYGINIAGSDKKYCSQIVINSCNGLILCGVFMYPYGYGVRCYHEPVFYYLHNLITGEYKEIYFQRPDGNNIPVHKLLIPGNRVLTMDYIINTERNNSMYSIRIYLYNEDRWENCGDPFIHRGRFCHPSNDGVKFCNIEGVFYKGVVNWLSYMDNFALMIFSFNVKNYCVKEIPVTCNVIKTMLFFGESKGQLYLILGEKYSFQDLQIMVVEKDYSSLTNLYHIGHHLSTSISTMIKIGNGFSSMVKLMFNKWQIHILPGARKEDDKLLLCYGDNMFSYNIVDDTID